MAVMLPPRRFEHGAQFGVARVEWLRGRLALAKGLSNLNPKS